MHFCCGFHRTPDCVLIHDVALLQQARGQAHRDCLSALLQRLAKERDISNLALVSVYDSHLHWTCFGFELVNNDIMQPKSSNLTVKLHGTWCVDCVLRSSDG